MIRHPRCLSDLNLYLNLTFKFKYDKIKFKLFIFNFGVLGFWGLNIWFLLLFVKIFTHKVKNRIQAFL